MPDEAAASALDDLRDVVEPVRARLLEKLTRLDREIAESEQELHAKKTTRTEIRNMIRVFDPTFEPKRKPGPKPKTGRGRPTGRDPEVALELLEANRAEFSNGNGFTGTELSRRHDWPLTQSRTSAALKALHERGAIRLDHTGTGGSKHYVLV